MQKDGQGNVHMAGKICDHPFDINVGMYVFRNFIFAADLCTFDSCTLFVFTLFSFFMLLLFCRVLNDAKTFANDVWEALKKLVNQ
jgi:hypothetical protein